VLIFLSGLLLFSDLSAHPRFIGATAPGRTETGLPPFAIRTREAIGLSADPTDLRLLSDGRILLFAGRQIAFGDGLRWEVFSQADDDATVPSSSIAVDDLNHIYIGIQGGFGRIVFDENGRWRIRVEALWEGDESGSYPILRKVHVTPQDWFWHGDSGPVVSWRPGQKPTVVARASSIAGIIESDPTLYVSDRADGVLIPLGENTAIKAAPQKFDLNRIVECAVTSGEPGKTFTGMHTQGVNILEQGHLRPLATVGLLAAPGRVSALAKLESPFFAAAIQERGLVFFTAQGQVVQFISRETDHRFGRIRRIVSAPSGYVYALLEEGIAIIQFPCPLSTLEGLIGRSVSYAMPFRIGTELWMETDGALLRGVYDKGGTLIEFVQDQPDSTYIACVSQIGDSALISTSDRSFIRRDDRWEPLLSDVGNLRVISPEKNGRWLCTALGQVGWLLPTGQSYSLLMHPAPGLRSVYDAISDKQGRTWLELGNAKAGFVEIGSDDIPRVTLLGPEQGVPEGWGQVFALHEQVGYNIADQILTYDEVRKRLVPAPELFAPFRDLGRVIGRPLIDSAGQVWTGDERGPARWVRNGDTWHRVPLEPAVKFTPHTYAVQDDGVVWMGANGRQTRFDPLIPRPKPVPVRPLVTHIEIIPTKRILFTNTNDKPELSYEEGSITLHFMTVGGEPFSTTSFEVSLTDGISNWTPVGSSGAASYNNLEEGDYSVRVRVRTGKTVSEEEVFKFQIQPPWYRSHFAYLAYFLGTLGLATLVAWSASYLQRRENLRLEELVAQRTFELNESNAKLERQVEEIRRLSLAISQSPVGIAIARMNGTVIFANPRFCDLFGYIHAEVLGRDLAALRLQPFTPTLNSQVQKTLEEGEAWHGQLTNQTKDGRAVHVRTTLAPIRSPDGQIRSYLILEEDISEWLAEQDRRHRLESQLLQAQKLDALGTLAGGIAHDFNNILTGILGYCELAGLDIDEKDRLVGHLGEIRGAGMRAKDLVNRILTFSRQSTPTLAPMDLGHAVNEAHKLLRASTPATIEYLFRVAPASILGDATQIHQVVVNLCTNAIHAIQGKPGRIEVELTSVYLSDEAAADLHDVTSGRFARLTVSDNGHGIPPETLARIFDPFFTTKQPGHGTGLGLAIVRAIVASHHGALRVKSTVGVGTTFELFFPVTDRSATLSPFGEATVEGSGERILVVDDEPTIANFVANRLRRLGYEADVFVEPQKALERFLADPYRYTAIVTDLTMPGMTGLQLLTAAREKHLVPAVIVSGYGVELGRTDPSSLQRCLLLPKPFNGNDLARAIQQILAEE
jgi:PAS domain S-box-containing protein